MSSEHPFIATIKRYFHGCSIADANIIKSTFCDDVVHYFTHHPPIEGADALAGYWVKMQPRIKGTWVVDHGIVQGSECVVEWTMRWSAPDGNEELMRGSEWYIFHDDKLAEIRAYYLNRHLPYERSNFELDAFPYSTRGYETL